MSEIKLAKAITTELSRRGFSPDLLVHYLINDPEIQGELFAVVETLIDKWAKNHVAGRYFNEADRRVQERAANIVMKRATDTSRAKTKRSAPPDSIWD